MRQQQNDIIALTALSFFGGAVIAAAWSNYFHQRELLRQDETKIEFIWNDDEESIPADGSLIKVEFSEGNTIYLGPNE